MIPEFSLDGKVAVVTGALGLLGREHCQVLAEAGANVVAADLDGDSCREFARSLRTKAIGVDTDVTDSESVRRLLQTTLAAFDRVDVLVNNAAVNEMFESPAMAAEQSRFENFPLGLWKLAFSVNITGVFLCSQVIGSEMARRRQGSIINIASTYGVVAPDQSLYRRPDGVQTFYKSPAYPATKGAVIAFTRYLAAYWGEVGVRVNALSPGGVRNGQDAFFVANYAGKTPLKRMAEAGDYRGAIVFLASDASSYMTGANLIVDGGWTAW